MIDVVRDDITKLDVDAIVNAANSALRGGGGVDGAIHRAAGPALLEELQQYDYCAPGDAVLTSGHRLRARYIIHTVGPIWRGGSADEPRILERAYHSCFDIAEGKADIRSIAFPAISTGVYAFPRETAARIALAVMRRHEPRFDRIVACLFDQENEQLYRIELERLRRASHENG
jgi:O-acetyl-ADP-ribose deacetylase (regulator of RNase III)